MENTWTMEDVKNDFTAIAEAAYTGEPQYVTSHTHPELVIITKSRFTELDHKQQEKNKKFVEYLTSITASQDKDSISPFENAPQMDTDDRKSFIEALLSVPQGDWDLESNKDTLKLRDVDL